VTIGSLFTGMGGLDRGLEAAGHTVAWQVERDPYCLRLLESVWPGVPKFDDVRTCGAHNLEPVDCIAGGFPCQDISYAGPGDGMDGARSGLWAEYARIVGELRPSLVLVENVPALLTRGMGVVLGALAVLGFDAEWSDLSACAVGAPHVRRRVFIVAYPDGEHGRPRLRDSVARAFRPLQTVDGFAGARSRALARVADPSALYRGADGVSDRRERNRAIGNAVHYDVGRWLGERLAEVEVA
jgi:DNA (cytosine-5)-methyltransferase 1